MSLVILPVRVTSHVNVRLTTMRVTLDEDSSHLYKILPLSIFQTYLQATASFDAQF